MPFRIFDTHQHLGPIRDGHGPDREVDFTYRMGVQQTFGVRAAAIMGASIYERANGQADTRRMNDKVAAYRDAYRDRYPVALGLIEPDHGVEAGIAEIHRLHDELHLDGVVWHHYFHGTSIDEPRMVAFVQELGRLKMPAYIHLIAHMTSLVTAARLENLALKCPDTTIVALAPFSHLTQMPEVRHLGDACPNVLFDTSLVWPINHWTIQFAEWFGSERIIFGSDLIYHPEGPPYYVLPALTDILQTTRLSEADKQNILWNNAERLFPALASLA